MMTHKITFSVDNNKWLKRLDTQPYEPTNQISIKVPKIVKPTTKNTSFLTLWTSIINSPMFPPSVI